MGLLTDPSFSQPNPIAERLARHRRKLCFLLYCAAIIWFGCLGHTSFNFATYLSENALSPGLVYSEIVRDSAVYANTLEQELILEREFHKTQIPYSWLIAKMKQIGLETYEHNFTLNYPFSGGKTYQGKNVYGILRAPRIASTEGIVFSTPYRPPNSIHTEITASVPILLAFAEFAKRKYFWSKDLIFLVTDQEQLGIYAWLEAYYKRNGNDTSILDAGNLPARAGALQAALNLEIQNTDCDYLDVKIEGLNGQLPNLDFFNLVQRITAREGLMSGYKQTNRKKKSATQVPVQENLKHMLTMLMSQANGVPSGNHGLFHRYRVEAITLEAVAKDQGTNQLKIIGAFSILKSIEGISRSLNNLLEKFHQSFFFYILVSNDRYVSIGDYIVCLILTVASLLVKAFLEWVNLNNSRSNKSLDTEKNNTKPAPHPFAFVIHNLAIAMLFGILAGYVPLNKQMSDYFAANNIRTEVGITFILTVLAIEAFVIPFFVKLTDEKVKLLHILTMLYIGSALIVVGLLNFALGFLLAIITIPVAIISDTKQKSLRFFSILYLILLHPLVIAYLESLVIGLITFPELDLKQVAIRALKASMERITFIIVDSMIYNNWLYTIVGMVFFPAWILLWILIASQRVDSETKKLKTN